MDAVPSLHTHVFSQNASEFSLNRYLQFHYGIEVKRLENADIGANLFNVQNLQIYDQIGPLIE